MPPGFQGVVIQPSRRMGTSSARRRITKEPPWVVRARFARVDPHGKSADRESVRPTAASGSLGSRTRKYELGGGFDKRWEPGLVSVPPRSSSVGARGA